MENKTGGMNTDAPTHPVRPWEAPICDTNPETGISEVYRPPNRLGRYQCRATRNCRAFCGRRKRFDCSERLVSTRIGGRGFFISPASRSISRTRENAIVADCRKLPFAARTKDIPHRPRRLHHLPALPDDLESNFFRNQPRLAKRRLRGSRRAVLTPFCSSSRCF